MRAIACLILSLVASCGDGAREARKANGAGIVSLDFCADQYVMALAAPEDILALSPDGTKSFSYLREQAKNYPSVRPRAEDILLLKPDIVVRTYGGGPGATAFFERAGIEVVQIGYAHGLSDIETVIRETADDIDAVEKGEALIATMQSRFNESRSENATEVLYLTSKGAVAGTGTIIGEVITSAGFENFRDEPGWAAAPLERLAYETPDIIAAGFFETSDLVSDRWTPARHPVVERALKDATVIDMPGAWTACGGWFIADAVEALASVNAP